jgi:hypothetical protein
VSLKNILQRGVFVLHLRRALWRLQNFPRRKVVVMFCRICRREEFVRVAPMHRVTGGRMSSNVQQQMDRWVAEHLFEEDVRALVNFLRPHRHERLLGWKEMRSGGAGFRVTVSWDEDSERENRDGTLTVPKMIEVLESILVGSARNQDALTAPQEFALYRKVVNELSRRIDEMQACYE